ncbi:MAG: DUF2271 domain-containing protein [Pseudomonadota bacterium]
MPLLRSVALLAACLASLTTPADTTGHTHSFENILGTDMTITVVGSAEANTQQAINAALAEIERLDAILSNYRADSEVERLNSTGKSAGVSPELTAVLEACALWLARSEERFSCKLGSIVRRWREAAAAQEQPPRPEIRHMARALRRAKVEITSGAGQSNQVVLQAPIQLDLSGLAKGYVIDRVFELLRDELPDAQALQVDIGGDLRVWRAPYLEPWQIELSTGKAAQENAEANSIAVHTGAVAASGHHARGVKIGRRHFSHILQPRDGWPLHQAPTTFVAAQTTLAADAIATALANMSPTEGLDWIATLDDVEALIILDSGQQLASSGWDGGAATAIAGLLELEFEIPSFQSGRYRRPYVAIWITNPERRVVRNLLLLGESQRWARENSRWWRQVGRRDENVLIGLARPTRRPGTYTVGWDGRDDFGQRVDAHNLTLHIEAAREHGAKDYLTLPLDASTPQPVERAAQGEIGNLALRWLEPRAAANPSEPPGAAAH